MRYGGASYVVYSVTLPNGQKLKLSWKVKAEDMEAHGIEEGAGRRITKSQFKALNFFGTTDEIQRRGLDEHPFQKFLKSLQEIYGPVSWLRNKEYMATLLMGYAEKWEPAELEQRLRRTDWYQNRSAYQRQWEQTFTKADREDSLKTWNARVEDELRNLYGLVGWRDAGITGEQMQAWTRKIASGVWGDPDEAFRTWAMEQRQKAEKLEGTQAWIERQAEEEAQRAFLNRPEDMFERIRAEAVQWLGPMGRPDQETLKRWAEDLVSERKSDGDWQQFLRRQAQALYPFLDPDEPWQDRASAYKSIAEQTWGSPIEWNDPILRSLGATDPNGAPTGSGLSFDDFERAVRTDDRFWGSNRARDEGFGLVSYLNETFNGVTA